MPGYARKRPIKRAPARKPRAKRSAPKKTSLVKTIKRVLHSQIENKSLTVYAKDLPIYTCSLTAPAFSVLHPSISQGVGTGQRVGNEIKVVSAKIRGFVNMLPFDTLSNSNLNDYMLKIWICRRKDTNATVSPLPVSADWNNFYQINNSSAGFQGNMLDMLFYPNSDYWTVFSTKTIRLGSANNRSLTNNAVAVSSSSGAVSVPFSFDYTKHLGTCKFNDNTSSYPTNKELYMAFQVVPVSGQSLTALNTPAEYHYVSDIIYEDA